jgi:hypothetical protein
LLLALSACDGDPKPAPAVPPAAASRPAGDGITPETNAIVAREGDHLVVIVDVAALDARGHKVEKASLEAADPSGAVRGNAAVSSGSGLTLEARVPAATKSVKLVGSSEGGASWSKLIPTDLGAR